MKKQSVYMKPHFGYFPFGLVIQTKKLKIYLKIALIYSDSVYMPLIKYKDVSNLNVLLLSMIATQTR
jgi:hypothetical protein